MWKPLISSSVPSSPGKAKKFGSSGIDLDGSLGDPSFAGLREDKAADQVVLETPTTAARRTNRAGPDTDSEDN
jgi:hypothetical protein